MNITELAKTINALSEAQKTELFEQITFSELSHRMLEKNVQDKTQFTQQFMQELKQEAEADFKESQNHLAI